MRNGDSRSKDGRIYPLQHSRYDSDGWDLDLRSSILAYRINGRLTGNEQVGHWLYDPDSVGDIHGGQLWKKNSRSIPMWRFATPAVTTGAKGAGVPTGGGAACAIAPGKTFDVLPIFDDNFLPDDRLEPLTPAIAKQDGKEMWPRFPRNFVGIVMSANKESDQVDLFFPTDPRLIAVNRNGDARMGSLVCDMAPGFKIDPDRTSPLQSHFWVLKKPAGAPNSVAWNIGSSGCGDQIGGFVTDQSGGGTGTAQDITVGWASHNRGGPFEVGDPKDKHRKGQDEDGNPINSLHWHTDTLFFRNREEDGPLLFEGKWPGAKHAPERTYVHLTWDGAIEKWRWYAETFFSEGG